MRFIWCMPRCRYNEENTYKRVFGVLKLVEKHNIPGTIRLLDDNPRLHADPCLTLGPVGRECDPKSLSRDKMVRAISSVLSVLHRLHNDINVCHCDVRWPNVMLDIRKNQFYLIDFEYCRQPGSSLPPIKEKYISPHCQQTQRWDPSGDTYQVALMITSWMGKHKDFHAQDVAKRSQSELWNA